MLHTQWLRLLAALALCVPALPAAEYALLNTGFRLRAERHEIVGDRVRLISSDGGVVELPATVVLGFEHDDYIEPAPLPQPAQPEQAIPLDELISQIARQQELPPELIHSIVAAESAYNPQAVSPKGAVGLMQIMPGTARDLKVEDRTDPEQNLQGGVSYLKQLLERYEGASDQLLRALAAYNAGPHKVDRCGGLPPYDETNMFVRRVIQRFLRLTDATSNP